MISILKFIFCSCWFVAYTPQVFPQAGGGGDRAGTGGAVRLREAVFSERERGW